MSRNKLTSKCIGENTKILLISKMNPHFLISSARPSTSFIGFSTFNFKRQYLYEWVGYHINELSHNISIC